MAMARSWPLPAPACTGRLNRVGQRPCVGAHGCMSFAVRQGPCHSFTVTWRIPDFPRKSGTPLCGKAGPCDHARHKSRPAPAHPRPVERNRTLCSHVIVHRTGMQLQLVAASIPCVEFWELPSAAPSPSSCPLLLGWGGIPRQGRILRTLHCVQQRQRHGPARQRARSLCLHHCGA
jgi:hypothetical protein